MSFITTTTTIVNSEAIAPVWILGQIFPRDASTNQKVNVDLPGPLISMI